MLTFPGAFHGGVNLGLNCAEAVNFAPADWLRFGEAGCARYRSHRKPSLLCYEWLVLKARPRMRAGHPDPGFRDLGMQLCAMCGWSSRRPQVRA